MMLDTGSSVTILYTDTIPVSPDKILSQTVYKDFNGDKAGKLQKVVVDSLNTQAFQYQNKILYELPAAQPPCSTMQFDGLLARPIAPTGFYTELNYEHGFVRFVKNPDLTGYQSTRAYFSAYQGRFEILLNVNGTDGNFIFDTGNDAGIYLDREQYTMDNPLEQISYFTLMAGNKAVALQSDVHLASLKLGDYAFDQYVAVKSNKTHNNIGLKFISQFNWILDQTNSKVYFKPIRPENFKAGVQHTPRPNFAYANVYDNKLVVAQMNYTDPDISVGDEIISINGENVTLDNQCEMASRFNSMPFNKSQIVLKRNVVD